LREANDDDKMKAYFENEFDIKQFEILVNIFDQYVSFSAPQKENLEILVSFTSNKIPINIVDFYMKVTIESLINDLPLNSFN
jgi:hypothetical protein